MTNSTSRMLRRGALAAAFSTLPWAVLFAGHGAVRLVTARSEPVAADLASLLIATALCTLLAAMSVSAVATRTADSVVAAVAVGNTVAWMYLLVRHDLGGVGPVADEVTRGTAALFLYVAVAAAAVGVLVARLTWRDEQHSD